MRIVTGAAGGILPLASDPSVAAGAPSWWDVVSGLLLAAGAAWGVWAQFVYPKIAERRARREGATEPPPAPPATSTPATPSADLVGGFFADQARRLDACLEDLDSAHRKQIRDAATIARLTAELAECRRQPCPHPHPGATP